MKYLSLTAALVSMYAVAAGQSDVFMKKAGTNPNCYKGMENPKQQSCKNGAGASVFCCDEVEGIPNAEVTETFAESDYVCVARTGECRPQCPAVYLGADQNSLDVYWTEDQGYCKDSKPEKSVITLFDWGTHGGLPMNDIERHTIHVEGEVADTGTAQHVNVPLPAWFDVTLPYNISGYYVENSASDNTDDWWTILPNTAHDLFDRCEPNPNTGSIMLEGCERAARVEAPVGKKAKKSHSSNSSSSSKSNNDKCAIGGSHASHSHCKDLATNTPSVDKCAVGGSHASHSHCKEQIAAADSSATTEPLADATTPTTAPVDDTATATTEATADDTATTEAPADDTATTTTEAPADDTATTDVSTEESAPAENTLQESTLTAQVELSDMDGWI